MEQDTEDVGRIARDLQAHIEELERRQAEFERRILARLDALNGGASASATLGPSSARPPREDTPVLDKAVQTPKVRTTPGKYCLNFSLHCWCSWS